MKSIEALHDELKGILSGQEYQAYYSKNNNVLLDLLDRLKNWLYSILKNIFPQTDVAKTTSTWLAYGLVAVGALLILLLLFLLFSRFVRQSHGNQAQLDRSKGETLTVESKLAEAHALAEQGEPSEALRVLFLGFILFLDQNHWLEAKSWKTNWEYLAELKEKAPHLANSFTILATKFEEAMYGGRPIAQDDYWQYHHQVKRWIHEGGNT